MAKVTGSLKDFGLQPMADRHRRMFLVPSAPAIGTSTSVFPDAWVEVNWINATDWEANVTPTIGLRPAKGRDPVHYGVRIQWLTEKGRPSGQTVLDIKLRVPAAGGRFEDLVGAVLVSDLVYIGPADESGTRPDIPIEAVPGAGWINTSDTAGGTVPIYEWED